MARLNVKLLALLLVTLATVISARVINVAVGENGELSFSPNNVKAKVGDKITFTLKSGFHSVILSDKAGDCTKSAKIKNSEILAQTDKVGKKGTFIITQNTPSKLGFFCDVELWIQIL
ncbi:18139_t:CDS:2, partial [Racocetra persica]